MRIVRRLVFALTLAALCGIRTAADTTPSAPKATAGLPLGTFTTSVTTFCNCSSGPVGVNLMHAETVDVDIGSQVVSVSTGFANCDPVPLTVAGGECVTLCYTMTLVKFCGRFFDTVNVRSIDVTVKREPVSCGSQPRVSPRGARRTAPLTPSTRAARSEPRRMLPSSSPRSVRWSVSVEEGATQRERPRGRESRREP